MMKLYLLKKRTNLRENGYSLEEEDDIYNQLLEEIYMNPRFFLDNLESMTTFRLSWGNYKSNTPIVPYKFVNDSLKKNRRKQV